MLLICTILLLLLAMVLSWVTLFYISRFILQYVTETWCKCISLCLPRIAGIQAIHKNTLQNKGYFKLVKKMDRITQHIDLIICHKMAQKHILIQDFLFSVNKLQLNNRGKVYSTFQIHCSRSYTKCCKIQQMVQITHRDFRSD